MSLMFGQKWLLPTNNEAAVDIHISAHDGKRNIEFCINRQVAIARLKLPPYQAMEPALSRWADAIKTACANAFVRPHAVGEVIRVSEDDFRPVLKFY